MKIQKIVKIGFLKNILPVLLFSFKFGSLKQTKTWDIAASSSVNSSTAPHIQIGLCIRGKKKKWTSFKGKYFRRTIPLKMIRHVLIENSFLLSAAIV